MAWISAKFEGRDKVMARLRAVVPEIDEKLGDAQRQAATDLANAIRARAPSITGEYKGSIQAAKLSEIDHRETPGIETSKDPNAYGIKALYIWRFLEFGAKGHVILPDKKPRLAFRGSDGRGVVVGSVNHPGIRAQPHIFPTYRAMRKRIRRQIAAVVNRAIKAASGMGHNGGPPLGGE